MSQARRHWLTLGFTALALATLGVVWWLGTGLFANTWPNKTTPSMEYMRNYFWSVGVVAAGIVGVWGFALAAVRTAALDSQAKTAQRESELNAQKHQSEAFATAINLLGQHGPDNFAIRLGAVYALESIAKSSTELHGPIFETLCAYVRQEAPAATGDSDAKNPDVVVQAILTVIGRRKPARDPEDFRLNLRKTDLRKCDLSKGHFENALLIMTHLTGATLKKTHLEGANLKRASLEGANLMKAHLEGANLWRANIKRTNLKEANLQGAKFHGVLFDEFTDLTDADLRGAIYIPAKQGYNLKDTVQGNDPAHWPDDDEPGAWDRGEDEADDNVS